MAKTAASLFGPVICPNALRAVSCRLGTIVNVRSSLDVCRGENPMACDKFSAGRVWVTRASLYWFSMPAVP